MTTVCRDWLDAEYLIGAAARDRMAGRPVRVAVPPRCGHDPADCPPLPVRELEEAA